MIKFLFECLLGKPNSDEHGEQLPQGDHSDGCFRDIQQKKDGQRYGQYGYAPLHPQPAAITVGKFPCLLTAHRSFCAITKKMIGLADGVTGGSKQPAKQQHNSRYQNNGKQTYIKPVSDTHLDVYKRQSIAFPQISTCPFLVSEIRHVTFSG